MVKIGGQVTQKYNEDKMSQRSTKKSLERWFLRCTSMLGTYNLHHMHSCGHLGSYDNFLTLKRFF